MPHRSRRTLSAHQGGDLIQRIDGEAAEEFGEEVSGLLRHNVAGKGYFPELLHGDGVGEEGDVGFRAAHLVDCFGSVAEVAEIGLVADLFGVEAEEAVEDDGVERGQVKLTLALGQEVESHGEGFRFGEEEQRAGAGDGDEGNALLAGKQFDIAGGIALRKRRDVEELHGGHGEGDGVKGAAAGTVKAMHDTMGGQDDQAVGVHVDEGHHDGGLRVSGLGHLVGGELRLAGPVGVDLFGVAEGGLVAVVAVGDDELLIVHGGGEEADCGGIDDAPEAVQDAVLVGYLGFSGAVAVVQYLLHAAGGVRVEHENLAKVGSGGFEQVEPVAFGLGEGLLVAKDDMLFVVMELAEGDEAAALFDDVGSGDGEALRVGKNAGVFFLEEDALLAPVVEVAGGTGVDAFSALGIEEFRQTEDDADQVVGASLVVSLLHGGGDLVVGLGDDVVEPNRGGIVAPGAKWINAGHTEGLAPRQITRFARWNPILFDGGPLRA